MITAVDTSVLVDVLTDDETFGAASAQALADAVLAGGVVACDVVWAETAAGFAELDAFRETMDELGVLFSASETATAEAASAAWRAYRIGGGAGGRIVSDFLIGAHALVQTDRLLARDRGFYRGYFRDLAIVEPSGS